MNKKIKLLSLLILILSLNKSLSALSYKLYTNKTLNKMTLHQLELHQAEILISQGKKIENIFLKNHALKKLKSNKKIKKRRVKRKVISKYKKKLKNLIKKSKESYKKNQIKILKGKIPKTAIIKFAKIADLNNDKKYELITIIGYKFLKKPKNKSQSYQYYYNKANNLFLTILSQNKITKVSLSQSELGRAEYINNFKINYNTGINQAQIEIIIHSLNLSQTKNSVHKQNLLLFIFKKNKIIKTLNFHPFYNYTIKGKTEYIIEHKIKTKDFTGDNKKELILKGESKKIKFSKAKSLRKSHQTQINKKWTIVFSFDKEKNQYKLIKTIKKT